MTLEGILNDLETVNGENVCIETSGMLMTVGEVRNDLSSYSDADEFVVFENDIWLKNKLGKSINSNPIFSIIFESKDSIKAKRKAARK